MSDRLRRATSTAGFYIVMGGPVVAGIAILIAMAVAIRGR